MKYKDQINTIEIARRKSFHYQSGTYRNINDMITDSVDFVSKLGRKNIISITETSSDSDMLIVVWYWIKRDLSEPNK